MIPAGASYNSAFEDDQALLQETYEVELQHKKQKSRSNSWPYPPQSKLPTRSPRFKRYVRTCWRNLMVRMKMSQAVLSSQRLMMGPLRPHPLVLLVLRRGWRRGRRAVGEGFSQAAGTAPSFSTKNSSGCMGSRPRWPRGWQNWYARGSSCALWRLVEADKP